MNSEYVASRCDPIAVTGSNGFIGAKVVEALLSYGFQHIRCFVRASSSLDRLNRVISKAPNGATVELHVGDLLSPDDCRAATKDVSVVYHLAAGMDKSFAGAFMNSVLTTRNLADAFLETGKPKRLVNVSSFAVYSNAALKRGAVLAEECPLENSCQKRYEAYAFGKLKQEALVKEYGRTRNLPYVIVRPGVVFGPGKRELTGRVGVKAFGLLIHIGGSNPLPLTFVDNCAEAIVLAGLMPGIDGDVFNIIDDEVVTSRQFLRAYKKAKPLISAPIPYPVAYGLCALFEQYSKWSHNQLPPVFNRRRCQVQWKRNRYSNDKAKRQLGWRPRVDMNAAMSSYLAQFHAKP